MNWYEENKEWNGHGQKSTTKHKIFREAIGSSRFKASKLEICKVIYILFWHALCSYFSYFSSGWDYPPPGQGKYLRLEALRYSYFIHWLDRQRQIHIQKAPVVFLLLLLSSKKAFICCNNIFIWLLCTGAVWMVWMWIANARKYLSQHKWIVSIKAKPTRMKLIFVRFWTNLFDFMEFSLLITDEVF